MSNIMVFDTPERKLLSLVIPCYNEEAVIEETMKRLLAFCESLNDLNVELIFIDDGSCDATNDILSKHIARDNRLRLISFARNFGHQVAVTAGMDAAAGDAVVVIDADLQDPPEAIAGMIEKWCEGYDVVYGVRTVREGETRFKLATAKGFYRILNMLSEVDIPLNAGDFRLLSRRVVNVMRELPERDRFLRGMVSWVGFKQIALPYRRAERFAGKSKYPLHKMLRLASDGIVSFSIRPLRLSVNLGLASAMLALVVIIYALYKRIFTNHWIEGWTAIMISVLFIGGVQLFCIGILGEYIGRIYNQVKSRPLYVVQSYKGFSTKPPVKSRSPIIEVE